MMLPTQYDKCIWCIRPLNTAVTDAADSPTKEHIFPRNIFGFIITKNCCKECNSRLGNAVDLKLLADERIILAARQAGIKEVELLSQYSGVGLDALNRQTKYTVKNGEHRFEPKFHPQGFSIGMIDGKVFPSDLQNAKGKMRRLVQMDKTLHLTSDEITKCIDDLFSQFLEKSGKGKIYCQKIKQGLNAFDGPKNVNLDGVYKPYETEWAIAKILYETAIMLFPPELFAKTLSALNSLKVFVEQQKAGVSIFSHESHMKVAQRWHEVNVSIAGNSIRFTAVLFGKEVWKLVFNVFQNELPAALEDFDLTVRNDFSNVGTNVARLSLNGKEWTPSSEL